MSDPMNEDPELDALLKRLPYPKAPVSLGESVIARLRAERELVWWRRPILAWPVGARVLGVGWLLALAVAVAYGLGAPVGVDGSLTDHPAGTGGTLFGLASLLVQVVASLGSALQACVSVIPMSVWWILGAAVALIYGGCLAVGTLIYRRLFSHHS